MKGFRQFLLRGNVVDLAVGVVIGAVFGAVVTALVKDLLAPLIAVLAKVVTALVKDLHLISRASALRSITYDSCTATSSIP